MLTLINIYIYSLFTESACLLICLSLLNRVFTRRKLPLDCAISSLASLFLKMGLSIDWLHILLKWLT